MVLSACDSSGMPLEKMETISAPAVASHLNPGGLLHFGQGQAPDMFTVCTVHTTWSQTQAAFHFQNQKGKSPALK